MRKEKLHEDLNLKALDKEKKKKRKGKKGSMKNEFEVLHAKINK